MTAILLERARKYGVQDDAILSGIGSNDVTVFQKAAADEYRYKEFFTYAKEQGEDLKSAIQAGYQIKYNTQGGLRIWVETRFGLINGQNFIFEQGRITKMPLFISDAKLLYATLAGNWVMLVSANNDDYMLAENFFKNAAATDEKVIVDLIFKSEYHKEFGNK